MSKTMHTHELTSLSPDARHGEFGSLRVTDLAPTQFAVDKAEVEIKAVRMRRKHAKSQKHMLDYLYVRPVPVVVREGRFCLCDHHHLVSALYDAMHEDYGDDLVGD